MKNKDFDDIGNRLHNLEADPPIDGWNKIKPVLHTPLSPKVIWLSKNWWKPLMILVPISSFLFYSNKTGVRMEPSTEISQGAKENSTPEKLIIVDADKTENEPSKENSFKSKQSAALDDETQSDNRPTSLLALTKKKYIPNNEIVTLKCEESGEFKSDSESSLEPLENIDLIPKNDDGYSILEDDDVINTWSSIDINNSKKMNRPADSLLNKIKGEEIVISEELKTHEQDSLKVLQSEERRKTNNWRLNASLTTNYLTKPVRPVANDEVLITNIDKSSTFQRIGFGFAFGGGKTIAPNLFLDAQLSVVEVQQSPSFSYTTGKVDTLLVVLQPDQNILVTPVYEINSQKIVSKYKYAGFKIGLTYYFWTTSRGQFNVMASAGTHYLFSSQVKTKIDGEWVSLNNEDLNKVNYSGMIGAGYNLRLTDEWELMINPALTYFVRDVKNKELPYSLTNQSLGLNIMLSKKLRIK